jgi:hypothetical protein
MVKKLARGLFFAAHTWIPVERFSVMMRSRG